MSSKKKIREYIDFKGLSVYQFEKITGLSHGILRSGKDFGVDKIKQIRDNLPDLNIDWLIYNEGEMIVNTDLTIVNEGRAIYKNANIKVLEDHIADVIENGSTSDKLDLIIKQNFEITEMLHRGDAVDFIKSEKERIGSKETKTN